MCISWDLSTPTEMHVQRNKRTIQQGMEKSALALRDTNLTKQLLNVFQELSSLPGQHLIIFDW